MSSQDCKPDSQGIKAFACNDPREKHDLRPRKVSKITDLVSHIYCQRRPGSLACISYALHSERIKDFQMRYHTKKKRLGIVSAQEITIVRSMATHSSNLPIPGKSGSDFMQNRPIAIMQLVAVRRSPFLVSIHYS